MLSLHANTQRPAAENAARLPGEAITGLALEGTFERMAKRRYQNPKPFLEGNWWWIRIWQDQPSNGRLIRKQKRIRLAKADTPVREVEKLRDERLWPLNQGLESIGSATPFRAYVDGDYSAAVLPLLSLPRRKQTTAT